MVQTSCFKVTSGNVFSILSTFECDRAMAINDLNRFIDLVGAIKGRYVSQGQFVVGLYFGLMHTYGWRAMGKTHEGYFRPDTRKTKGREYKESLDKFRLLIGEDLAQRLRLPPFFEEPGGGSFCTAVESDMIGGVFYLEAPAVMTRRLLVPGVTEITRTEYAHALVAKADAT